MANTSVMIMVTDKWQKAETLMNGSFTANAKYLIQVRGGNIIATEADDTPTTEAGLILMSDGFCTQYVKTAGRDLYLKTCGSAFSEVNITEE